MENVKIQIFHSNHLGRMLSISSLTEVGVADKMPTRDATGQVSGTPRPSPVSIIDHCNTDCVHSV